MDMPNLSTHTLRMLSLLLIFIGMNEATINIQEFANHSPAWLPPFWVPIRNVWELQLFWILVNRLYCLYFKFSLCGISTVHSMQTQRWWLLFLLLLQSLGLQHNHHTLLAWSNYHHTHPWCGPIIALFVLGKLPLLKLVFWDHSTSPGIGE